MSFSLVFCLVRRETSNLKKREDLLFWKILVKIQEYLIILLGIIVTCIVAGQCLGRFVGINFHGYEELLIIAVFWLYMLGCGYGSYENSQIRADILETLMNESLARDIVILLKHILTLLLGAVMFVWAIQLVQWSAEQQTMTTVYRLPMTIGHSSMVVGLGLTTFFNLCYCYSGVKYFVCKRILKSDKKVAV